MNQIYAWIAIASLAIGFGSGWQVNTWKTDAKLLQQELAHDDIRLEDGQASSDLIAEAQDERAEELERWDKRYESLFKKYGHDNFECLDADELRFYNQGSADTTR